VRACFGFSFFSANGRVSPSFFSLSFFLSSPGGASSGMQWWHWRRRRVAFHPQSINHSFSLSYQRGQAHVFQEHSTNDTIAGWKRRGRWQLSLGWMEGNSECGAPCLLPSSRFNSLQPRLSLSFSLIPPSFGFGERQGMGLALHSRLDSTTL
jgi:hypothetical protein